MTSKEQTRGRAHGVTTRSMWLTLAVGVTLLPLTVPRARAAEAPTYTVLYNFSAQPDGSRPSAGVIADATGNLYGAASQGGAYGYGTVYEVPSTGAETVLYSFTGGSDGAYPSATLIRDGAGNLYGTAEDGGTFNGTCPLGCGVVFQVSPQGKERVLYSFTGGSDGYEPASSLIRDAAGNFYGTAPFGGINSSCVRNGFLGCGVVFKLSLAGKETVLYSFTGGSDGAAPNFGLIKDTAGNFYGTTSAGGDTGLCSRFGCGVVFKLDPAGNETPLYSFTGGSDGWEPDSVLTTDAAGNIYGTTVIGGNFSCGQNGLGCGVVFKLDSAGNETTLYTFSGPDGAGPVGGLVRDASGDLYGTASGGGVHDQGAIFKLASSGRETLLHSFTGTDGAAPAAGLLVYKGALYGTAYEGGAGFSQYGVVFKIVP